MKQRFFTFFVLCFLSIGTLMSQINTGIDMPTSIREDGAAPDNSAMLDVQSTTKGVLVPRMTTAQRNSIVSPATGLLVFDFNTTSFWFFNGIQWIDLSAGGGGGDNLGNHTATQNLNMSGNNILDVNNINADVITFEDTQGNTIPWTGQEVTGNKLEFRYAGQVYTLNPSGNPTTATDLADKNYVDANDDVNDADASPTNELQTLAIAGNNLSISGGNTVALPGGGGVTNLIQDADNDTQIQVEEGADDDIIRMDLAGTEKFLFGLNANGDAVMDILNNNGHVFMGDGAGASNTAGGAFFANTFIGRNAGTANSSGDSNTFIGDGSGLMNTIGFENTFLGTLAGSAITDGVANVFVGFGAGGANVNGAGNVYIGHLAGSTETGDHKLYIDNGLLGVPLIYGEFDNQLVRINGTLNVNNAFSFPLGDGANGQVLTTNGAGLVSWANAPAGIATILQDADSDTRIQVEANPDEDLIRFDLMGTEEMVLSKNANGDANLTMSGSNNNIFIGNNAGAANTNTNTIGANTFMGHDAGAANTSGFSNTFIGADAGMTNTTGEHNTFLGEDAGTANTIGLQNTFLGGNSGFANTEGNWNTFVGHDAGLNNIAGMNNTFLGQNAGLANTYGNYNTFIGRFAGATNTIGNRNTFVGFGAEALANDLENASAIGFNAKVNCSDCLILGGTGLDGVNVGVGLDSAETKFHMRDGHLRVDNGEYQSWGPIILHPDVDSTGDDHIRIHNTTDDISFSFIQVDSVRNFQAFYNTRHGYRAYIGLWNDEHDLDIGTGDVNFNGSVNLVTSAIPRMTVDSSGQVGVGTTVPLAKLHLDNGDLLITGGGTLNMNNSYFFPPADGFAGQVLTTNGAGLVSWANAPAGIATILQDADSDTRIQVEANPDEDLIRMDLMGTEKFTFSRNANGDGVLGIPNNNGHTFIGNGAGAANIHGLGFAANTFVGQNAGVSNTIGDSNTFLGDGSGNSNASGFENTYVGVFAGGNSNGSNNVCVGRAAGLDATGSGNVFLGSLAGTVATGSNKLYIENSPSTSPLIYGDFVLDIVNINGSLGVGTQTPDTKLEVETTTNTLARIHTTSAVSSDNAALQFLHSGGTGFAHRDWEIRPDDGDLEFRVSEDNFGTSIIPFEYDYDGTNIFRQLRVDGHVRPITDDTHDLGSAALRWDDVFATNGVIQTSDLRTKQNISNLTYGLAEIMALRPVSFEWAGRTDGQVKLGLIAQEVLPVVKEVVKLPEAPQQREDGTLEESRDLLGVYYADLIPVLIKGIQEQQALIETQKTELQTQESKIESLENKLESITKALEKAGIEID